MSKVKRYNFVGRDIKEIEITRLGYAKGYVRSKDYDALIEKLEVLVKDWDKSTLPPSLTHDEIRYEAGLRRACDQLKRLIEEAKS
jgi:hypothetical protein